MWLGEQNNEGCGVTLPLRMSSTLVHGFWYQSVDLTNTSCTETTMPTSQSAAKGKTPAHQVATRRPKNQAIKLHKSNDKKREPL